MSEFQQIKEFKLFAIKNIFIYLFIFTFIFTPFIIPAFNIIHLLAIIAYWFLLTSYKKDFFNFFRFKVFRIFVLIHVGLIFYTLMLGLFAGDFGNTYYVSSTIFEVLPICLFITFYLKRFKISYIRFLDIILLMGFIQFLLVLGTVLSPFLRDLTLTFFPKGEDYETVFSILGEFRMFGLTRNYTFAMPLFMGLCIIISFVLGNYNSKKYYLLIPFFIFSIVTNGRIGLIAFPIVLGVVFLFQMRHSFFKQIIGLIVYGIIIVLSISYIEMKSSTSFHYNMWTWLNDGISEIQLLKQGEKTGNMEALADTMWVFPEEKYFLFGTGESLFGKFRNSSDIGYVLNFYYGGLMFCTLLYYAYYKLMSGFNSKSKIHKSMFVSIIIFVFLSNLKGTVFRPNEIIHGVLLISVFTLSYNSNRSPESYVKFM